MKKISPYRTTKNALNSIDNGGRFFNLLTKANDGNISASELGKVAGVYNDQQKMVLYLEMSLGKLNESSKNQVISALSGQLKSAYQHHRPDYYSPSEANRHGTIARNTIITGTAKLVNRKSDFSGFIMVPIISAGVTTMMMIPMIDHYDVYEIRDNKSDQEFLIAHARNAKKIPQIKMHFGGVLKELKSSKAKKSDTRLYLNTHYYCLV
jgi:hypothetical protein